MTELEILRKVERLRHADVAIVLKHHHGHRASGNHVTNNVFSQDVEAELNVGDCLNNSNGNQPEDGNQHADNVGPGGKAGRPACNNTKGDGNHDDEEG